MYPSIPIDDAIYNIQSKLRQESIQTVGGIPSDQIGNLLHIVLENTYFSFEDQIFKQIKGLPMGSPLSGLMAILFMDSIEKQALQQVNTILTFRRYVDDCFVFTKNQEAAQEFHALLNAQNDKVQFEIELPANDNVLSLLDFTVTTNNNNVSFEFYKKGAKKNIFLNYHSNIASSTKLAIIKNERNRIFERCTNSDNRMKHIQQFDNILRLNNYPESFIERSNKKTNPKKKRKINYFNNEKHYLKIPFISDDVNHKIKRILRSEQLNIGLAQKSSTTLRSALRRKIKRTNNCRMSACPIKNNKLCFQKNVVYKVTCLRCQNFYIGSTIRTLHVRIKEHMTRESSSIFKHLQQCDTRNISTEIISYERDNANIRLMEAQMIQKHAPHINSKDEKDQYRQFLFI